MTALTFAEALTRQRAQKEQPSRIRIACHRVDEPQATVPMSNLTQPPSETLDDRIDRLAAIEQQTDHTLTKEGAIAKVFMDDPTLYEEEIQTQANTPVPLAAVRKSEPTAADGVWSRIEAEATALRKSRGCSAETAVAAVLEENSTLYDEYVAAE